MCQSLRQKLCCAICPDKLKNVKKEKGFSLIILLITVAIIAIIIAYSGYLGYGYITNSQTVNQTKENLIQRAKDVQNQETENLKKQLEEGNKIK
jgi:type II secretory pathway pseudopilin PulG